ncbi:MAG: hypothetical protein HBSAPP03_16960 [Phycisphaerae bacterium]|nr:MAG: hypothetical protein HBSAPP03_16960 [Phycisphaerae bacterium]
MSGSSRYTVLYPTQYVWYIFASTLDILMTYAIIWKLGGREVNAVARHFIEHYGGHWGLIILKYLTVVLVVAICESVGRRNGLLGRRLAVAAIIISAFPVGYGIVQVAAWTHAAPIE